MKGHPAGIGKYREAERASVRAVPAFSQLFLCSDRQTPIMLIWKKILLLLS